MAEAAFALAPNVRFARQTTLRRLPTHRRFIPVHTGPSANLAHAAAAAATAATLSLVSIVRPAGATSVELVAPTGLTVACTLQDKKLMTKTAPKAVVIGVGKSPIHDYDYLQRGTHSNQNVQKNAQSTGQAHISGRHVSKESLATSGAEQQEKEDARCEFLLAARLVTAVMMGVMLGVERRATMLNLGVRSLTVISVTAALATVISTNCTANIHQPAVDISRIILTTLNSSNNRYAVAPALVPASATVILAAATSAAVFCVSRTILQRRHKSYNKAEKHDLEHDNLAVLPSMSAAVGLDVGMGVACGAGLGLMAAGFYLAAVAAMRSGDHAVDHRIDHADTI